MNHKLLLEFMHLLFEFEKETEGGLLPTYAQTIDGFKKWIRETKEESIPSEALESTARKLTTEQQITLALFKMANYSKMYWRSLLADGSLTNQDNWIVLLNLSIHGEMTKMELIRRSTQEKPTGMQIINRLIQLEFVLQKDSEVDKRSKIIEITPTGQRELLIQMSEIQRVSSLVTGDLRPSEKQQSLYLLNKLMDFHEDVFKENKTKAELLNLAFQQK
ncbi:MarR family winged helix-turn-helix transcriptional regulator [Myroides sp. TSA_177.3]|uniref:MarR family winged helix-turn-helix transcriptional regulator n=1 Tax=Myroides sp. TSA_177.3 TaxID=3415650 RepID=UPI004046053E